MAIGINEIKHVAINAVVGGSGMTYPTIASAITGELSQGDSVTFGPTSGGVGTVTGPGSLSAINNFYKDYWLVNTGTPTNGMQAAYGKVVSYNGTTKTFIIDSPFNWAGETLVTITLPITISLLTSITENVVMNITPGIELNLSGCRLTGSITITTGIFHWIRDGWITDGVAKTTSEGVMIIDSSTISRPESNIYAVLIDETANIGRAVLHNCDFRGRVSARRIRMAWEIQYCRNQGVTDAQGNDLPYVMCEATGGITLAPVQLSVQVTSEFSGSIFYADIASTISTGGIYLSIQGALALSKDFANATQNASFQRDISIWRAHSSGVIACTVIPGQIDITYEGYAVINTTAPEASFSVVQAHELTGSIAIVYNVSGTNSGFRFLGSNSIQSLAVILVRGAATTSGNVSLTGNLGLTILNGVGDLRLVRLDSQITGTITLGNPVAYITNGTNTFGFFYNDAVQNVGTPVVNITGAFSSTGGTLGGIVNLGTLLTLNFTISGNITANNVGDMQLMDSSLSGGLFQATGIVSVDRTGAVAAATTSITRNNGTGGTMSVTNNVTLVGGRSGAFTLARAQGAGATCSVTGNVKIAYAYIDGATGLIQAFSALSTAKVTGILEFLHCTFINGCTVAQGNVPTASTFGPSSFILDTCAFLDEGGGGGISLAFIGTANQGTVTWAGATFKAFNTDLDGLVVFSGTPFTSAEWSDCYLGGNQSTNIGVTPTKSIESTGVKPAIFRFWKCRFRSRYNDLEPDVIYDWTIRPPAAALTTGQLTTIDGSGNAVTPIAASTIEGVLLITIVNATLEPAILVRRGEVFVDSNAVVATGDNLILDTVTPSQATSGASVVGQRVGRALENSGATMAGRSYAVINIM